MGICNSKPGEECEICQELYEDIDDRVSELPMMSPILLDRMDLSNSND